MSNINLSVEIAGIRFKNPVMGASGTFGSGKEFNEFYDISDLGAVVTKGVSNVPWSGNPTPRVCETPSGMMNAIGLQNPGVEAFIKKDFPFLEGLDTNVIVNVCGHSIEEYVDVVARLNDTFVSAYEINVSCPNVKEGGIAFGTNPKKLSEVTAAVVSASKKPVIIKLSPNVTNISEMALAAEASGASAVSLINTLIGMKIDINRRNFVLANKTGGLSGPAIHPVAVRMVYEVSKAVKIPVIGMGGIATPEDAIEMIMAGARAIMIGTANFHDPLIMPKVVKGMEDFLFQNNIKDINEIIGCVGEK